MTKSLPATGRLPAFLFWSGAIVCALVPPLNLYNTYRLPDDAPIWKVLAWVAAGLAYFGVGLSIWVRYRKRP
jgi:hypothetical protein